MKGEAQQPPCYIRRIGTAVPDHALGPAESAELFRQAYRNPRSVRMLPRLARLTGIQNRHLAVLEPRYRPEGEEALYRPADEQPHGPGMGMRTALFERVAGPLVLRALEGFPSEELARTDMLITASCTHASAPGLERPIFDGTPVRPTVDRWNLGFMGCSAGLAGLRLGLRTAACGAHVLVVACELSSLHFQYHDDLDQITANMLFADGAAAVALSPCPTSTRVLACRSVGLPEKAAQMVWFADDYGLRLTLSPELPETLAAAVPGAVEAFLADNGLTRGDIRHWLVHPGGPQILDAVEQALGLPAHALDGSREVLKRWGNMSSPTIFFILRELLAAGPHGLCVAMAFGPGLTIELALLALS